ncbi:2657_t:CDS:1, partial [Paraglomus occultum]
VPVFQLPTRGSTWYMMAMEPAKLLGFRDSYLFFLRNPSLKRIYATEEEREYLIDRNILSSNFRNRQIALVSARSTFKVFGYKIIKGGKRRRDDYYEAEVPDGYDDDPSDYDVSESTIPGNGIKRNTNSLASSKAHAVLDETNWMYQSALAIREFNTQLRLHRRDNPKYYDPHTNLEQMPQATQPTRVRIEWASDPQKYPSFDVRAEDRQPEITFVDRETNTLGDLDEEVLEVLPQDVKDIVTEMRERAKSEEAHGWEAYPLALMDGQYQSSFSMYC